MTDQDEGLGGGFWAKAIGIGVGLVLAALVVFLLFGRVWYTYGFIATFLLLAVVLIVVAWLFDRREAARRRRHAA